MIERIKKYLPSRKAFTALLVGSIMAILVGAILLIVAYVVIGAVMGTLPTNYTTSGSPGGIGTTGAAMNTSLASTLSNIAMALNISGISLIVAGIAGIIYMLIGLTRTGGAR
jgi:hypothetical protein